VCVLATREVLLFVCVFIQLCVYRCIWVSSSAVCYVYGGGASAARQVSGLETLNVAVVWQLCGI
jgi:hypothetical protein